MNSLCLGLLFTHHSRHIMPTLSIDYVALEGDLADCNVTAGELDLPQRTVLGALLFAIMVNPH